MLVKRKGTNCITVLNFSAGIKPSSKQKPEQPNICNTIAADFSNSCKSETLKLQARHCVNQWHSKLIYMHVQDAIMFIEASCLVGCFRAVDAVTNQQAQKHSQEHARSP